jgi:SAM-dependent methyltransferase
MNKTALSVTSERRGFALRNPALANIYQEWYQLQRRYLSPIEGQTLELGSGAGFIKRVIPSAITSDVVACEGIDLCLDALEIGSRYSSQLANVLMVNVFHHIFDSARFLRQASSSLLPGGRLVMIEPWVNIWSSLCYRLVGHEPLNTKQEGWTFPSQNPLFDSNQAQAWIVFERDRDRFFLDFPEFRILKLECIMPVAYLLTGGHSKPTGLPPACLAICRSLEKGWLDRHYGLFALIVIEKLR